MKLRNRAHSSSLFLLELIIAIVFFAVAAGVCLQLFTASHVKSNRSEAITKAVSECSSVAELLESSDTELIFESSLSNYYKTGNWADNTFTVYFDKDFKESDETSGSYVLTVNLSEGDNISSASINLSEPESNEPEVYGLNVSHHFREEAN